MTTDTKEIELAKQLFLDAVNGNMTHSATTVEMMAKRSMEYAAAFYRQLPQSDPADIVIFPAAMKGCPACFGSGGKVKTPCKKCGGKGRVALAAD